MLLYISFCFILVYKLLVLTVVFSVVFVGLLNFCKTAQKIVCQNYSWQLEKPLFGFGTSGFER